MNLLASSRCGAKEGSHPDRAGQMQRKQPVFLIALWDQLIPYLIGLWIRRWFRIVVYLLLFVIAGKILQRAGILN